MGPEKFQTVIAERARRMAAEKQDPFTNGYESPIWSVADDLLCDGRTIVLIDPPATTPKEILGASEILATGSNRSSKSEWAGKKCMKILNAIEDARGWSFADTGPISIARQQPLFWKYMPARIRDAARGTGKFKAGAVTNVSYSRKNGFTEQTFVLDNGAQHWFKNYAQDLENVEGDQLDVVWLDEGAKPELVKTLRFRLGDRGGVLIVTFTPIDDSYTAIVNEYDKGSRTVLTVPAELLPVKDEQGEETGEYETVPRVKVAGPGSDGNQRANIVYFHITDNPYFGFSGKPKPGETPVFGKERFYKMLRGATRAKILSRAYGVATRAAGNQFPKFSDVVHIVEPARIPRAGTNFHVVDPCDGRNWFMIWLRVDRRDRRYIYREWPSTGHPGAYIPGVGDPGPWALPGTNANGRVVHDGVRGTAQTPLGWGLERYKDEILRLEGRRRAEAPTPAPRQIAPPAIVSPTAPEQTKGLKRPATKNPLPRLRIEAETPVDSRAETISERWMDSRYGAAPTTTKEGSTTLIEQMDDVGLTFLAASGKEISEGVALINDALDYDDQTKLGDYSPALSRINEPKLFVSSACPNVIYALREWTGKDGQHGACKDPIDVLRYVMLEELQHIGDDAFHFTGGGAYGRR